MLAAAVVLGWPLAGGSPAPAVFPSLSPFVAAGALLATGTLGVLAMPAAAVLALAAFFPRWFCRYGCPTGLLQETAERIRWRIGRPSPRAPTVGIWLVAMTLGGACLGYPLFLWLDPLALFNAFLNAWRQPPAAASVLAGLGLPLLVLLDLIAPRLWCRRLCPLGATQDLCAMPRRLLRKRRAAGEGGTGSSMAGAGYFLSRRVLLAGCAGAAGAMAMKSGRVEPQAPLRPPGSIAEGNFTGVCTRCGNCAGVCPSGIIEPDLGASGVTGLLTPKLDFAEDYCREDCHRCGEVCPSGAIAPLALAEKRRRIIGVAAVDLDLCLLAQGRECTACIRLCPYEAIAMQSSDGGFTNDPYVDLTRCNGCGACESVCPVRPLRAIHVVPGPGMLAPT